MMQAPCKGCTDRVPAHDDQPSCHAYCERYKAFKEEKAAYNEARRNALDDNRFGNNPRKMKEIFKQMRWK